VRAQEEYYEYQLRCLDLDKAKLAPFDSYEDRICGTCGHAMKEGDGKPIFNVQP